MLISYRPFGLGGGYAVSLFLPRLWWDRGKSRMKGTYINFCKERSQAKCQEHDLLSRLAAHLKIKIDSGATSFLSVLTLCLVG